MSRTATIAASPAPSGTPDSPDFAVEFVVIGIGNSLLTDDGAGIHVIESLAGEELLDAVRVIDGGTLGLSLLESIEDAAHLIVVDAAEMDAPAGTVRLFHNRALEEFLATNRRPSVHEVNLLDVLGAARLCGKLPPEITLVAIQPETIGWGGAPTAAVARGIGEARTRILELIDGAAP